MKFVTRILECRNSQVNESKLVPNFSYRVEQRLVSPSPSVEDTLARKSASEFGTHESLDSVF